MHAVCPIIFHIIINCGCWEELEGECQEVTLCLLRALWLAVQWRNVYTWWIWMTFTFVALCVVCMCAQCTCTQFVISSAVGVALYYGSVAQVRVGHDPHTCLVWLICAELRSLAQVEWNCHAAWSMEHAILCPHRSVKNGLSMPLEREQCGGVEHLQTSIWRECSWMAPTCSCEYILLLYMTTEMLGLHPHWWNHAHT